MCPENYNKYKNDSHSTNLHETTLSVSNKLYKVYPKRTGCWQLNTETRFLVDGYAKSATLGYDG